MNGEMCREKILSEDYWDFLIPAYRWKKRSASGGTGMFSGDGFWISNALCGQ